MANEQLNFLGCAGCRWADFHVAKSGVLGYCNWKPAPVPASVQAVKIERKHIQHGVTGYDCQAFEPMQKKGPAHEAPAKSHT